MALKCFMAQLIDLIHINVYITYIYIFISYNLKLIINIIYVPEYVIIINRILCSVNAQESTQVPVEPQESGSAAPDHLLGVGTGREKELQRYTLSLYYHVIRRIYRPPIPPRWPLLAQDKWCACVLSTRLGSTSELVIDNFNVLVQVVSLGIFWLSAVVPRGL